MNTLPPLGAAKDGLEMKKRAVCMLILVPWSVFLPALLAQQPGLVRGTVKIQAELLWLRRR